MNRKAFLQISGTALIPIALGLFPEWGEEERKYAIKVNSDSRFGHLLRSDEVYPVKEILQKEIVVVGGGIAGLAAAWRLKDQSVTLLEASDRLGGTSAAGTWKDTRFAIGAHYELAYPETFGNKLIQALQELKVIKKNFLTGLYDFVDDKYVMFCMNDGLGNFSDAELILDLGNVGSSDDFRFFDVLTQKP